MLWCSFLSACPLSLLGSVLGADAATVTPPVGERQGPRESANPQILASLVGCHAVECRRFGAAAGLAAAFYVAQHSSLSILEHLQITICGHKLQNTRMMHFEFMYNRLSQPQPNLK